MHPGHRCSVSGCGSVLVIDGNMKNQRDVCNAADAGYAEYTGLDGFIKTGCMETPEQTSKFCSLHKPRILAETNVDNTTKVMEMLLNKRVTRTAISYEVSIINDTYELTYSRCYG